MPDPIPPEVVAEAVDHKTTQSRPVEPVTVAVVGTGDGSRLATGTIATTPGEHQPNMIVQVVTPLLAVGVRFANLFLTTLVGLLVASMTPAGGAVLHTGDFVQSLLLCSSLAFPGAALGALKDLITIFGKLEGKYPLLTGSI